MKNKVLILRLKFSDAYSIYLNNKKIVQCNKPLLTALDLLKQLDIKYDHILYTDSNDISPMEYNESIEDGLEKLKSSFDFDTVQANEDFEDDDFEDDNDFEDDDFEDEEMLPLPNVGDDIYIESSRSILETIFGGKGIVKEIHEEETDTFITLEELPGKFFSWSYLGSLQEELKLKYGESKTSKL